MEFSLAASMVSFEIHIYFHQISKVRPEIIFYNYDNVFFYLAHVIEQPNFRIPNPQYLQQNFCFDFFNDSENTF